MNDALQYIEDHLDHAIDLKIVAATHLLRMVAAYGHTIRYRLEIGQNLNLTDGAVLISPFDTVKTGASGE